MKYAAFVIALVLGIFGFPQTVQANNNDTNILFKQDAFAQVKTVPHDVDTIGFNLYKSGMYQIIIPTNFEVKNFKVKNKAEFYKYLSENHSIEFKITEDNPQGVNYVLELENRSPELSGQFSFLIINKDTGRHYVAKLPLNWADGAVVTEINETNNFMLWTVLICSFLSIVTIFIGKKFLFRVTSGERNLLLWPSLKSTYRSPRIIGLIIAGFFILKTQVLAFDDVFVYQELSPSYTDKFSVSFSGVLEGEGDVGFFCEAKKSDQNHYEVIYRSPIFKTKIVNDTCNFDRNNLEIGTYDIRVVIQTPQGKYYSSSQNVEFKISNNLTNKISDSQNWMFLEKINALNGIKFLSQYYLKLISIGLTAILSIGLYSFALKYYKTVQETRIKGPQLS